MKQVRWFMMTLSLYSCFSSCLFKHIGMVKENIHITIVERCQMFNVNT